MGISQLVHQKLIEKIRNINSNFQKKINNNSLGMSNSSNYYFELYFFQVLLWLHN